MPRTGSGLELVHCIDAFPCLETGNGNDNSESMHIDVESFGSQDFKSTVPELGVH